MIKPALLLTLSIAVSGCISARVDNTKDARTGIAERETVLIMPRSHLTGNETELKFVSCVAEKVASGKDSLDVYPAASFVDQLFPWFEPRVAPRQIPDLDTLMERPGVADKIAALNVRYIVWVRGDTDQTNSGGGMSCAVGPGGGGCFGLAWWEDTATYQATVWDLKDGTKAGSISANLTGTSAMPAFFVPVPLVARTRAAACKALSQQLQSFIIYPGAT